MDKKIILMQLFILSSLSISHANTPSYESLVCNDVNKPEFQQRLMDAINRIRSQERQCGQTTHTAVAPLSWNENLAQAARIHAQDIATHMQLTHIGSNGSTLKERLKLVGYPGHGGGENVARGQKSLDLVLISWLKSPPHCANLMQPKFQEYSIACAHENTEKAKPYWVQVFGITKKGTKK